MANHQRSEPLLSGLTLRVVHGLDDLQQLSEEWDSLLTSCPAATTFSTKEWLICWWQTFATNQRLLTLALFNHESELVSLAPLSISVERFCGMPLKVLRLAGDGSGDADNLDIPAKPGYEEGVAEAIVQYLKQHKHEWNICQFNTTPTQSSIVTFIVVSLNTLRWVCLSYSRPRSYISLPDNWNEYTQQLSPEDRNNLERYSRRLYKRYRTRIYRCADQDELPRCLDALFHLHQLRWEDAGEPGSFASPERRDFYRQLSTRLLPQDLLELWILELDDRIAAVQFAFRLGNTVFQLQEGYDPERASDRVGFILRGAAIKKMIEEKNTVYDFLGGKDPYKARWAAQVGEYKDIHFAPAFSLGGALLLCVDYAARCKVWLRATLPDFAWTVLHTLNLALKNK